jgi:hypothetical protein
LAAERLPALREAGAEITRELRRIPFLAKSITGA